LLITLRLLNLTENNLELKVELLLTLNQYTELLKELKQRLDLLNKTTILKLFNQLFKEKPLT